MAGVWVVSTCGRADCGGGGRLAAGDERRATWGGRSGSTDGGRHGAGRGGATDGGRHGAGRGGATDGATWGGKRRGAGFALPVGGAIASPGGELLRGETGGAGQPSMLSGHRHAIAPWRCHAVASRCDQRRAGKSEATRHDRSRFQVCHLPNGKPGIGPNRARQASSWPQPPCAMRSAG
jgi:hypothetical protein